MSDELNAILASVSAEITADLAQAVEAHTAAASVVGELEADAAGAERLRRELYERTRRAFVNTDVETALHGRLQQINERLSERAGAVAMARTAEQAAAAKVKRLKNALAQAEMLVGVPVAEPVLITLAA